MTSDLLHYMDDDDYNETIYYCKGDDVIPRLEKVIAEAAAMEEIMSDDEWHGFSEYQMLVRVLSEQSDGGGAENMKLAAGKNTELVATALTGKDPDKLLDL